MGVQGAQGRGDQGRPVREHSDRSDMGAEPCRLTICLWGWKTVQSVQGPVLSAMLFYTSCHTSGDSLGLHCPCYDFKLLSLALNPSANSPN